MQEQELFTVAKDDEAIVRQYGKYPVTFRFMPEDIPETEPMVVALLMQAYAERIKKSEK